MGVAVQCCTPPDPDDPCQKLRGEIRRKVFQRKEETGVRGLQERIMDQIYGRNGPGTPVWINHDREITAVKSNIDHLMEKFRDNQCGDKAPLGADAKYWINRPNPKANEWKGPKPAAEPATSSHFTPLDRGALEKATGLTGGALLLYLLLSEGSRVFLPRNLVPMP